ncbi:MAG: hypothetical protein AVDCRST_MAG49-4645, partial [uncultured Thermomicrobiales bacterium]
GDSGGARCPVAPGGGVGRRGVRLGDRVRGAELLLGARRDGRARHDRRPGRGDPPRWEPGIRLRHRCPQGAGGPARPGGRSALGPGGAPPADARRRLGRGGDPDQLRPGQPSRPRPDGRRPPADAGGPGSRSRPLAPAPVGSDLRAGWDALLSDGAGRPATPVRRSLPPSAHPV